VKRTGKSKLSVALAAALLASAGCQSTGSTAPKSARATPAQPEREVAAAEPAPAPEPLELRTVYFDYNRWELRDEAKSALRSSAAKLQASPEAGVVTVAGHCDERGSEEYNIALGDRRAAEVKRYLVDLGIDASRVRTVSFGESRPVAQGEGEAVWSRNRRAELTLGSQQASR